MCIECGLPTVWDLLKGAYNLLKDPVMYAMSPKRFADDLRKEVLNLGNEAKRVYVLEEQAGNNVRILHGAFTDWKASAEQALKDARELLDAFGEASMTCCYGTLPDPCCHCQFSTKAEAQTKVVRERAQQCIAQFKELNNICFIDTARGKVQSPPVTASASSASTLIKPLEDGLFESRTLMIQNVMDALANNSNSVVGIYGMGGVGKSTLLVDVEKGIRKDSSFGWVAKADVSENPDIKRIQGEIADALGLSDINKKETVVGRAELLRSRLEKEEGERKKKVLIILDNLWAGLDLKSVGIPCGDDNKARGCKLLLTSRDLNVLRREMRCEDDSAFHLDALEKEEAERLFERMVGGKVPDDLKTLVEEALRISAGLPFLIVAIAKLFINTSYSACKDDLKQIWNEETGEKINKTLRISYERIKPEEAKSLLQLIAVYGVSKPSLENLVRYGFGLGLLGERSMEDARDRLSKLIKILQDSSLLLRSEEGDGFKIHDLVREFVASIISKDRPLLVLKDESVAKLSKDELQRCEAICFPYVDMKKLPQKLVCPELRIFLLFTNHKSLEVPDSYFNFMRNLKVLNLTRIRLNRLPSPFQFLENLRTLCMDNCSLEDVAILAELKELEILSLRGSEIRRLPKEIGQLVELRLLDLSDCYRLEIIEPDVLGSLTKLEELYMERSFDRWSAGEQTPATSASLMELNNMKKLRTLYVSIPDPSALPKDLDVEKLTKYRIRIGDASNRWQYKVGSNKRGSRTLELRLDPTSDVLQKECIRCIFDKIDDLLLERLDEAEQSICEFSQKGFPQLKHLQVQDSPSIHCILRSPSLISFKALESLRLKGLINLEKICDNRMPAESFSTLKVVKVENCDKMEVLFPRSVVRRLPHLEEIEVEDCKLMRGIVEADDDRGKLELPKLRVLKLRKLPNIQNFITANLSPPSSTSGDQVGTQIAFFNGQQVAFPSLETLELSGLGNPGFMFSPSMVKSLAQLRKLSVSYCKKMEAIVLEEEGLGVEISETLSFPMLTDLHLTRLGSLTCFSRKKCLAEDRRQDRIQSHSSALFNREVAFPSLETLQVWGLGNPGFIFSPSMVKSLAQLRKLRVCACEKMEAIITEEEGLGVEILEALSFPMLTDLDLAYLESLKCFSHSSRETRSQDNVQSRSIALFNREVAFPNLETLKVNGLDNIGFMFSPSMVKSLTQLRKLSVTRCKKMKAIVMEEEGLGVEISETLSFPMLTYLHLDELESLTCFSRKKCSREGQSQDCVQSNVLFNREVSFPFLDSLTIEGLPNLKEIWSDQSPPELSNLRSLKVVRCESLSKVIRSRTLVKLHKLQTVRIKDCGSVQEIFYLEGPSANGDVETPSELTTLELNELGSLRRIWNENPSGIVSFHKLKEFELVCCDNLEFIFFPSMVKSLAQLRYLTVSKCKKMETIIAEDEGLGMEISKTLAFSMLTDLHLHFLESLKCFSRGKCSREAQSRDRVNSHSAALFSGEVDFPSLETLKVSWLGNPRFTFSPSMVKSLAQLRKLEVRFCKKMEAIIVEEEGLGIEISEILTFPMLTDLSLVNLESLKCFSHGSREARSQDNVQSRCTALFNREVAFPNLETLEVKDLDNPGFLFSSSMVKSLMQLRKLSIGYCNKMETIIMEEEGLGVEISDTLSFPMLTDLGLTWLGSLTCFSRKKCSQEGRSQDRVQSNVLFNREVALPGLETLSITGMDSIEMIWDNQVVAESFPKLKSLVVERCNKLVTVVPPFVLGQLKSLESLEAKACGSLEVVFGLQPLIPLDGHPVALPLKELKVSGLPKLKCVWDKELHRQVKFQRLRSISVSKCNSFTSLFPASVTRDLIQLEELVIRECGIAELIEKEGELLVPRFVFPKLTSLQLEHLTELKCLYNGKHTSHWPTLKTLKMDDCSKVEILASQTENEIQRHKQPLFLIQKGAFPNLQEVKLDLCERMEIWHGDFHDEEFFRKLRVLKLRHLSKESATSTSRFIENLTNLEELVIRESYLEEPSSNVEAMEGPSQEQKVILPFSRQIKHLKALNVSDCDGLSSMFTPAIAENLVALTKLRISNCRILTEVVSAKGSKEGHEVAFHHLKCMELDGLIELKCFSSGGRALIFPLLEDVIVNGCPNMRFFSEGPIEAPKLERVKVDITERYGPTKYQYFWEENLNMTIQNMFKEMANFVRLFEFPELIGKWHNEHNPVNSSWQIENLVVDKCPSFINAMPSKLMLVLEKMMSLHVRDCESLEEIFNLQGLETVESTRLLPRLEDLSFINLLKLRQLWNKDLQGTMRFNALSSLTLYKCSNLRHAFTPSMALCLANLYNMEIRECDQMEGVIEDEEGQGSAVEKISFPRLGQMILKRLPNLTSFLSGKSHVLDCPELYDLRIAHCPKMRSLTWQSSMDIDHNTPSLFTPRVQFHGLSQMVLSHMDNLSKIWTDNPLETLTFDSLLEVKVKNCKSLENLFPHWVATSLTQLKKLRVESCRIEEIVANGDDTPHSNIAQVLFPKLTSLVLHEMPRLMTFCPNLPTLNWQLLEESRVTHCDKLNMLSIAASMNKWTQRNDQQDLLDQEAHSSFERDFPNLERLLLFHKDIEMIQDGKYPDDIFGKSKALTMACFHEENTVFPSRFLLERFQNLEGLEVFCSSFEDIFPDEGFVVEERNSLLESLRVLKLSKLCKLKRVWREDGLVSKILRNIETLEVRECPSLTILFPAATSFQNLTELVVKNSSGLVHLGTASAIASLVHLWKMTIIGCERMKEIVAKDENEEGQMISFGKLEFFTLRNMPSLECFSSTKSCILRFPSLRGIEVEECPKMNIFCKGRLSMPELRHGTLFRYEWYSNWEGMGDLNRAIKKLSS